MKYNETITYLALSRDMATNIHADEKKNEADHGLIARHPNFPNGQCLYSYIMMMILSIDTKTEARKSITANPTTNRDPGWSDA